MKKLLKLINLLQNSYNPTTIYDCSIKKFFETECSIEQIFEPWVIVLCLGDIAGSTHLAKTLIILMQTLDLTRITASEVAFVDAMFCKYVVTLYYHGEYQNDTIILLLWFNNIIRGAMSGFPIFGSYFSGSFIELGPYISSSFTLSCRFYGCIFFWLNFPEKILNFFGTHFCTKKWLRANLR